jgi:hypothetical protein
VADTDMAADHSLLSSGRNGTPGGEVKRGRVWLPDGPGVEAFLFSSPSSLRMDSKTIALSNSCWKVGKV